MSEELETFPVEVKRVLRYFEYEHLPTHLQEVSKDFYEVAYKMARRWEDAGDFEELVNALRLLVQAKDAAVRSVL